MEKRDIQLGMSYSTAMSRLERKVIFWLAQKVDLDVCYCCGKKIERPEDLSIEHKLPWLNIDPARFWDLNNIAFSHKKCNKRTLLLAPDGQAWCSGHKAFLPVEQFSKNLARKNNLCQYCKECSRL